MSRSATDFRTTSIDNYKDFCKKNPSIKISLNEWKNIIYAFNESLKIKMLETGEKIRFPFGFGDFAIVKKERKINRLSKETGEVVLNLPIDWVKTNALGKRIYIMNYHTEGFFFGWKWFKKTTMLRDADFWYFKASRYTSRLLAHYLKVDNKYQHIYQEWI